MKNLIPSTILAVAWLVVACVMTVIGLDTKSLEMVWIAAFLMSFGLMVVSVAYTLWKGFNDE